MNNITKRAARVLQEIDAALEMTEKSPPGPWTHGQTCAGVNAVCLFQIRGNSESYTLTNSKNDAAFIAASRTGWPTALRCLKTAIEGLLEVITATAGNSAWAPSKGQRQACDALAILCEQWEASRP